MSDVSHHVTAAPFVAPRVRGAVSRVADRLWRPRTRVFLSYARKDKVLADALKGELRARGLSVVLDREVLLAGQDFERELRHQVRRSDLVLLLVTAAYRASEFCAKEREWALDEARSREGVFVVPLLTDSVGSPSDVAHLEAVELHHEDLRAAARRLVGDLRQLFGRRTGRAPGPTATGWALGAGAVAAVAAVVAPLAGDTSGGGRPSSFVSGSELVAAVDGEAVTVDVDRNEERADVRFRVVTADRLTLRISGATWPRRGKLVLYDIHRNEVGDTQLKPDGELRTPVLTPGEYVAQVDLYKGDGGRGSLRVNSSN
ncbi:toll/interleukin-1 receptor domain-containing protein [Motilibacter deserti]|uniref:Toll/interleukin-1 receptor domain-containing protein n=1 Tax=Motilibacter deserti TaxID=2714956 RepID=A0ABX0GR42_9ACTN|nr:toll/interleukin-1 receptor domain-containing protein [Motilibacter deserti]NHC12185.1 toll/interleukin-1 receptor domain-containing protein [Motilibacter deserti]